MFACVLCLIAAVVLYATPVGLFMIEPEAELSPSDDLSSSKINVLLLGVDKLNDGAQRSDTILIATIGYDSFKLTSIMRDTMVDIPGHGRQKVNAAYSHGGAELTMRTLNENFGFNITKYVVVDFTTLSDLVNAIGGVDIAITEKEQTEINKNVLDSWRVFRKLGYSDKDTRELSLNFSSASADGTIVAHLDGFQALGYARIRHIDSDYTRTSRQRKLMNAALTEFRSEWFNPLIYTKLARVASEKVETNLNIYEMLSIGIKAAVRPQADQLRLPIDGSYKDDGSALTDVDYQKNLEAFLAFAY